MIILQKDLELISGYKKPQNIKKWLEENGIGALVSRTGEISTTISAIDEVVRIKKNCATKMSC
jgi:hypothetical protein